MPGEIQDGMGHSRFEALLSEAIDGLLSGSQKEAFETHGRTCPACGPLLADVVAGQQLLKSLEELEPPVHVAAVGRSREAEQIDRLGEQHERNGRADRDQCRCVELEGHGRP